ncbi:MAG TPA: polysaccharide deacetylase family protein [Rubrivivax sp.]|nr:polysaccharide deacetylase family protein [Rubrivivax sp.]
MLVRAAGRVLGGRDRLSVIALHSIRKAPDPLFPAELDVAAFDRLVAHLAGNYSVMRLGDGFEALRSGRLPPRALVITFDDGYADNATLALPVLRRRGVAATFFVATGFLDGGLMWNDSVIECLRRSTRPSVDLSSFGLREARLGSMDDRRAAIDALLPVIKYQTLAVRREMLARLQALCGDPELPRTLMMTSTQVRELAAAGMEIGAHTVNHPILACEMLATVQAEVAESRRELQALTGQSVDVFAFPNGRPGKDYRREHVQVLRDQGFRCAVSTAHGIAAPGDDPLQLPRFTPWDRSFWRWSMRLLHAQRVAAAAA